MARVSDALAYSRLMLEISANSDTDFGLTSFRPTFNSSDAAYNGIALAQSAGGGIDYHESDSVDF